MPSRHGGGVVRLGAPHSPEHGERRVREAAQIVAERGRLEPLAEWDERHLLERAQLDLVTDFLLGGEVRGLQPLIAQLLEGGIGWTPPRLRGHPVGAQRQVRERARDR